MTTVVGLSNHTLSTLVEWKAPLFVSAFVPSDFSRPQPTGQIKKALRRLAQITSTKLTVDHGLGHGSAAAFVAPLLDESILDDVPVASRGLAVFLSADTSMKLALPVAVGPAVEIGDGPDLLRLLPAVVGDVDFFSLTIGKKGPQLFRGRRFAFEPVDVPDMPRSIDDALWYIRREPVRNRDGAGVLHGSGGGEDLRKDDVHQYLHLIDKAITPILGGGESPLVIIGVEYEAAMFINSTHYRHTFGIPVLGSPEGMPIDELHERSWELVKSHDTSAAEAVSRLHQLAGTGKTAADPNDLIAAGESGSVRDLLVARSVVDDTGVLPMSAADRRTVVAVVNDCLRQRATIHIVDDADVLGDLRIAAILRY
jgi:hypothetical protein